MALASVLSQRQHKHPQQERPQGQEELRQQL